MSELRKTLEKIYWQIENQFVGDDEQAKEYWVDEFEKLIQQERIKAKVEGIDDVFSGRAICPRHNISLRCQLCLDELNSIGEI